MKQKIAAFISFLLLLLGSVHANQTSSFEGSFERWDQKKMALVSLFLPENPLILEIGGHYGGDTLNFVRTWPHCNLITFEPNPHAFDILQRNTALYSNINAQNLALNQESGTTPFYICYGSEGNNSAFEHASSTLPPTQNMKMHYQGPQIEVPCIILDEWCAQNKVDHVDFLWLSSEGLELPILRSSPKILSTIRVICTKTYFYPFREHMTQYAELKEFLELAGFKLLSHWYVNGLQGDAIFIRNDFFDGVKNE